MLTEPAGASRPTPEPVLLSAGQPDSIATAAQLLREGGVVVVPTDTVYGLAASVFQEAAINRVFAIKQRRPEARVPVLFATARDLPALVREVPRPAWRLIDRFWPGPVTLVLPARASAPSLLTGGLGTIAVRVPAARSCLRLLETLGEPLVGTSANLSGQPPATTAAEAIAQLDGGPDAVLVDDEAVRAGVASTVVEVRPDEAIVHRVGAVSVEQVRQVLSMRVQVQPH